MVIAKDVTRIAFVSVRRLLVESLSEALAKCTDVRVIGIAADAPEAIDLVVHHHAQVAIVCARLPRNAAFEFLRGLRTTAPNCRAILLDTHVNLAVAREAVRLGAAGYCTYLDNLATIRSSIRDVASGGFSFHADIEGAIAFTPAGPRVVADYSSSELGCLTPREMDVLICLALGDTVKDAARRLELAESTVDNHKSRLMRKLKVHRTVDLVKLAIREKLVPE